MIVADSEATRRRAAEIIAAGGIIAFRTDTFYGLGVDPFNAQAVYRLKELKGRDDHKPILLLISDRTQLSRIINGTSRSFELLAARLWPGPLTLVGNATASLPHEITAGSGTVGVRLADDESVLALVRTCGGALTATSANVSGQEPARSAKECETYFANRVELIIDGGEVSAFLPSTVVDATGDRVKIIREGATPSRSINELFDK